MGSTMGKRRSLVEKHISEERDNVIQPLSIATDKLWYGNDGPWSTFLLGFGTPAQYIHSLVSTSIPQPYVVLAADCTPQDPSSCIKDRGSVFKPNASSSWSNLGIFTLEFEENLGFSDNGQFGKDSIALGIPGSSNPTMEQQIMAGVATKDFIGSWGIRPAATNLSSIDNPIPSLVQNLKNSDRIPSLSWGYTAGAYYQSQLSKSGEGSLTIGGYDASRFMNNSATFQFSTNTSRDLEVGIQAIATDGGSNSLLSSPILAFIDSAVSHLWLPPDACEKFESTFDLTYDEDLGLYLVNDTVHENLIANNATISFTLSNDLTLGPNDTLVTIDTPYSYFDLQLTPEYYNNTNNATYYFPIRQASDASQYTLGRAFLQEEAYLIADYERKEFSVHQTLFPSDGTEQDIRVIQPLISNVSNVTTAGQSTSSATNLSAGAIAGIVVGVIAFVALICASAFIFWRRRRRRPMAVTNTGTNDLNKGAQPVLEKTKRWFSGWSQALEAKSPTKELGGHSKAFQELSSPDEYARELSGTDKNNPERHEMAAIESPRELEGAPGSQVWEMAG